MMQYIRFIAIGAFALAICLFTASGEAVAGQPDPAEIWPQFRGPSGDGHSPATGLPTTWSEQHHVKWKTAIHGQGWSTPVVWGDQIWLTTATKDGKKMSVICVDRATGKVLLDRLIFSQDDPEPLGNTTNSYASPSAVIEAGRVYVHFGSYGTACIDTKTFNEVWRRSDLPCRHLRGPGSSLALFEDLLIVTMDGADMQYLIALNKETGKKVWRTKRTTDFKDLDANGQPKREGDLRKAYTTPLIAQTPAGLQLISPGAKAAFGYDPRTGKELWTITYDGFSNAASAVVGHGHAYINTGYARPKFWAVKLDGAQGDITDTHVTWEATRNIPKRSSPLLVGDLIFLLNDAGIASCVDARTGDLLWSERIGREGSASPVFADGHVYFFAQDGKAAVVEPARTFKVVATNELDAGMMASPAIAGKSLFIRTKTHLYRIEK